MTTSLGCWRAAVLWMLRDMPFFIVHTLTFAVVTDAALYWLVVPDICGYK
jgi:hypothetical protein